MNALDTALTECSEVMYGRYLVAIVSWRRSVDTVVFKWCSNSLLINLRSLSITRSILYYRKLHR